MGMVGWGLCEGYNRWKGHVGGMMDIRRGLRQVQRPSSLMRHRQNQVSEQIPPPTLPLTQTYPYKPQLQPTHPHLCSRTRSLHNSPPLRPSSHKTSLLLNYHPSPPPPLSSTALLLDWLRCHDLATLSKGIKQVSGRDLSRVRLKA